MIDNTVGCILWKKRRWKMKVGSGKLEIVLILKRAFKAARLTGSLIPVFFKTEMQWCM